MKTITGIQQVGIGVSQVYESQKWYSKYLGYDVAIFDEAAEAKIMLPYTDNQPQSRHAILAYNMRGGGGFEIWQYTHRTPEAPAFEIALGDLGIFACKIKAYDIEKTFAEYKNDSVSILSEITETPEGRKHFFIKDPYNNIFEIEENKAFLLNKNKTTGGSTGVIIGVSDIEKSKLFYSKILGYDKVVYEEEGIFEDLKGIPGSQSAFKRVLLSHKKREGAFAPLLGESTIELVEVKGRKPEQIYKDRLWGDLGFIHLCFDIINMKALQQECEAFGHPFTVDSSDSFDMGEAAGHFSYIEDPDGTLIEFVETHKIPIMKKLGWYLNLIKRGQTKALPKWFFRILGAAQKF